MKSIPLDRVRALHREEVRPGGSYVLYWMIANRRATWNFALQRAADWATELGKPLLVLEPLRCGYPWASDRLHTFVMQGMADNAAKLKDSAARYYPYVEPRPGEGRGLLDALARRACVVVTDDYPAFFLPRMVRAACRQVRVRFEAVDSVGLLPMRAADRPYPTAYAFRRFLQKTLLDHLELPRRSPLARRRLLRPVVPAEVIRRWPAAPVRSLQAARTSVARLPVDHEVAACETRGGSVTAGKALRRFLDRGLERYDDHANHPDARATSLLSPYLHFGHLSSHEVCSRIFDRFGWTPDWVASSASGGRSGWWGLRGSVEAFLDQIVTWRELGFNMCCFRRDHDRYESLPDWAKTTLAAHAADPRPYRYGLEAFDEARTHDPIWNAAQRELVSEGRIHNYLRMLWGKKILHWTRSPRQALEIMIELNNRYALDGRDPNSYSGIFWVLGRYDRPWGPERPVFGKIRYMSSRNTRRKLKLDAYLDRYAP